MHRKFSFKEWVSEASVQQQLAIDAGKGAVAGGQGAWQAGTGVAKVATGNLLGIWDVVKGAIDAFKGFSNMGTAASDLVKVMNFKTTIHQELTQQRLPADDVIKVLFDIDTSVSELFSPALMKATLTKFANSLNQQVALEQKTFAACLSEAAREVYGSAQRSADAARQKVAELIKQTLPLNVQKKVEQVIQSHTDIPEAEPVAEDDKIIVQARSLNVFDPQEDADLMHYLQGKNPNLDAANQREMAIEALKRRIQTWGQAKRIPKNGDKAYTLYGLGGQKNYGTLIGKTNWDRFQGQLRSNNPHSWIRDIYVGGEGPVVWDSKEGMWYAPGDSD